MPACSQRLRDHAGLRLRVGHRVAVGLAAVVERAAPDHAVDVVAVALGRGQRLEQHRADALARHVAVAALAEALAAAVLETKRALRQQQVLVRVDARG